ncbi:MAG: SGNH/GDSL hydrolase family protein [Bacteroidota bacterium]
MPPDRPRYLALGDSYTIGEGVAPESRWPVQLASALRASGIEIADPEIIAVTGWTTDELDAGITEADPLGPFALVTLLVGVNDQYRGGEPESYRAGFHRLLERAVGFAGGDTRRVVVVSFPDWGRTAFAPSDARGRSPEQITREVDIFNAIAREESETAGVAWVGITPLSREQGAMTVGDDLHPDGEAYRQWSERILPAARAALAD